MRVESFRIKGIPALLWGEGSKKVWICVHGSMSSKCDSVIRLLAEQATQLGYDVLSFDLPEHGERKTDFAVRCNAKNCAADLASIYSYAAVKYNEINLFGCSMGAYFGLLALKDMALKKALFLSPVVNMLTLIENMMAESQVSEEDLRDKKVIATTMGQTLYWDYYSYVKANPIRKWNVPTAILYGSADNLQSVGAVTSFAEKFHSQLTVFCGGEHYFHTGEQLEYYTEWLKKSLTVG